MVDKYSRQLPPHDAERWRPVPRTAKASIRGYGSLAHRALSPIDTGPPGSVWSVARLPGVISTPGRRAQSHLHTEHPPLCLLKVGVMASLTDQRRDPRLNQSLMLAKKEREWYLGTWHCVGRGCGVVGLTLEVCLTLNVPTIMYGWLIPKFGQRVSRFDIPE